jgi:hypothetical protein
VQKALFDEIEVMRNRANIVPRSAPAPTLSAPEPEKPSS